MSTNNINPSDIRLIQMANYVLPVIKEDASKDWVLNGKNNSFYKFLIDRRQGSVTNGTLIDSYSNLIYGNGLISNGNSATRMKVKQVLKAKEVRKIIADFYLYGEATCQVIKTKGGDLSSIEHLAKEKVAPNKADNEGDINSYWVCDDWSNIRKFVPIEYPAFNTSSEAIEIYDIKPYQSGNFYFANPVYLAGIPYMEMEEQIGHYSISHIKNGLSFGYIINIPNGATLSNEEKDILEQKIKDKLVGSSNAGKFILSFNGADTEITIVPLQVNDAHKQWQFLTEESRQQIMTAHKVTSPMLFGIKDNTGLGNNANELDEAEAQLLKRVIKPLQQYLVDAFEEILAHYGIYVTLHFRPLTEINDEGLLPTIASTKMASDTQFEEGDTVMVKRGKEHMPEHRGIVFKIASINGNVIALRLPNGTVHKWYSSDELNKVDIVKMETDAEKKKSLLDEFIELGEVIDNGVWDLIYQNEVDYDEEEMVSKSIKMASTGYAYPNAKSEQDGDDYIVRYKYVGDTNPEREFCKKMMNADKVYRKEDIIAMEDMAVNPGFGLNGTDTYSIWLWKGGGLMSESFPNGTCKHKWNRVIYLKKGVKIDVNSPLATIIGTNAARKIGINPPINDPRVAIAPHDMALHGHKHYYHPSSNGIEHK